MVKRSWEDGLKVYFAGDGWVAIRFSGTEPALRIFCEMGETNEAQQIIDIVENHYQLA